MLLQFTSLLGFADVVGDVPMLRFGRGDDAEVRIPAVMGKVASGGATVARATAAAAGGGALLDTYHLHHEDVVVLISDRGYRSVGIDINTGNANGEGMRLVCIDYDKLVFDPITIQMNRNTGRLTCAVRGFDLPAGMWDAVQAYLN